MIGLIIAILVIGQPFLTEKSDLCDKKVEQSDDKSETNDEAVSSLEAVSPTHQVQDVSTAYYILDEVFLDEEVIHEKTSAFIEKVRTNLIRVLFNFIIAPNAP